ncbi:MAG: ABC transporter permease [Acidobacteriota bacterium]
MIDSLLQDLRFAFKTLRHAPGFAAVAVITLALGIGANTAIFSVVNGVLLAPLPYPEADRLVRVWESNGGPADIHIAWANYLDWREARSFESIALHPSFAFGGASTVIGGDQPTRVLVSAVTVDFFRTMGVAATMGRVPTAEEHVEDAPGVAVVSNAFWRTQLGGTGQLGERTLRIGSAVFDVIGVMPPGFRYPVDTDVWIATERYQQGMSRTSHNFAMVGRLRDGVTLQEARAELDTITAALKTQYGDDMDATGVHLRPLREELVGSTRQPLLLMLGAAGLVLLVACTNLASTLLARASARRREIAIRSSVGASRLHVVRQMLIESLVLAVGGAVAGLLLAVVVLRSLLRLGPALPRAQEIGLHPAVLGFTALIAVATAFVFGIVPALRATRIDALQALRSGPSAGHGVRDGWIWKGLVAVEVALAVTLLIGAGLLIRSFEAVMSIDPGMDPRGVLTVDLSVPSANHPDDAALASYYQRLLGEIEALPGVQAAGAINHLPLGGMSINGGFAIDGRGPQESYVDYRAVMPGYFEAMGIPLLRGRTYTEDDRAGGAGVVVVNEAFARAYFADEEAVGRRIGSFANDGWVYGDEWLTIIGVVGNVHHSGLTSAPRREVYVNGLQRPMRLRSGVVVARTEGDPAELIAPIRARIAALDPEVPAQYATLESIVTASTADRRFLMIVLGVFAAVALTLSAVGIYGVVSYSVARRTREMGIRLALGAPPTRVRTMVILNAMQMVLIGVVAGLIDARLLSRFFESLLWQVSPTDPWTAAGVVLALAATAWVASFVPARRGAAVDPLLTMRSE